MLPCDRSAHRSKVMRSLNKQVNALKDVNRETYGNPKSLQNVISDMKMELDELKSRTNCLEKMNENLQRERNVLTSEIADLRKEKDKLECDC